MPQMAPLSWLTLMILFSMILISFNMINFYTFSYSVLEKKISIKEKKTNWKW
uniref:ATP synthase complex subunit 8 n=1 Tax=Uloma sp. BMNH 1425257 TaxID=1859511 RepID=A0A191ZS40_9CUCU|nr:ATP synthase F0 subunit 8 [Uloma sp. BMNH 1425257]